MWVNYQHPPLFCFHYSAIVDVVHGLAGELCKSWTLTLCGSHLTIKNSCFAWSALATRNSTGGVSATCSSSRAPERGRVLPPQFTLQWHNPERPNTCCVWHKAACPTCAELHWLDRKEVAADSHTGVMQRTSLSSAAFLFLFFHLLLHMTKTGFNKSQRSTETTCKCSNRTSSLGFFSHKKWVLSLHFQVTGCYF